MHYIFKEIQ